jgi:hypothetical protein
MLDDLGVPPYFRHEMAIKHSKAVELAYLKEEHGITIQLYQL